MRPIRLLILLLAIALTVVLALVRPLQGRAARLSKKHRTYPAQLQPAFEPVVIDHYPAAPRVTFGHRVVAYARNFLGVPYQYGGASPSTGFDCSGLVRFVYAHFGIPLPHSSFADVVLGQRVGRAGLRPGDLVFFSGASHVGIYIGSGRFIDAPHTGTVVRISTMQNYGFYSARRLRHA